MLREPIGEYKVGICRYETPEIGDASHKRRVPLTFFFPAEGWEHECPYRNSKYQQEMPDPSDNGVRTYCGEDAELTDKIAQFPVVLYNHGFSGHEMESTVLCADLASSGYVVASVGHPYGSPIVTYTDGSRFEGPNPFENGKLKMREFAKMISGHGPLWYEDIRAAVDFLHELNKTDTVFKGRLLLDTLGTIGVSFGGCCSVAAALKDGDLHYAANLDGTMFVLPEYNFPDTPILVMCNPLNIRAHQCLTKNSVSALEVVKIKKVTHFEFSDGVYLSKKGSNHRDWAERISTARAEKLLEFIQEARKKIPTSSDSEKLSLQEISGGLSMFDRVTVKQINDHLWLLDDNHEATGYLVAGSERALVIDTMNGYANVRAIAESLTDKPLTVINTHGHPDHIYGNVWFEEAYLCEKDLAIAHQHCSSPMFVSECEKYGVKMPPFKTVKGGDVIDLGGLTLDIIELPGHTPGGICLLLREDRILFTGDSINHHLWMQLEGASSLSEMMANLDKIAYVKEQADYILHGHALEIDSISLFDELREGLRQLVEQKGTEVTDKDEEYNWFGGKAIQHKFAENSVIVYTQSKLNKVDMQKEFEIIDSFCGIDCSSCEFHTGGQCAGCKATGGSPFYFANGEVCSLADCCIKRNLRWCADCAQVPCENLKKFSNDPEHGDKPAGARLERLLQIKPDLLKKARRGHDPITVCGLVCGEHCFLGEWCGWCGSEYNCCSFATLMPDGVCPNVKCVKEKGFKGCFDCPELDECKVGFYGIEDKEAANLAKAGALFIREYGATLFMSVLNYILNEKKQRYTDFIADKSSVESVLEALKSQIL